jgi:outer membrane cobalamin receptor
MNIEVSHSGRGMAGLRKKSLSDRLNLEATEEYIRLTHEQYKVHCNDNDFQVTNLSSSMISGAETGVSFSWKGLSTIANYTYIDARDTTKGRTDNTLPYKPKHSVYTSLDYQYSRFMIGTSLRYVSKVEEAMFHPVDTPKAFYTVNTSFSVSYIFQRKEILRYRSE